MINSLWEVDRRGIDRLGNSEEGGKKCAGRGGAHSKGRNKFPFLQRYTAVLVVEYRICTSYWDVRERKGGLKRTRKPLQLSGAKDYARWRGEHESWEARFWGEKEGCRIDSKIQRGEEKKDMIHGRNKRKPSNNYHKTLHKKAAGTKPRRNWLQHKSEVSSRAC